VKPWTRIGPLGPFRGRLGLQWVIAPLVLGAVLAVAVWALLAGSPAPGGAYRSVGSLASFPEGSAAAVGLPGVYVARSGGHLFAVKQQRGCPLTVVDHRFVDCRGNGFGLDGRSLGAGAPLGLLPLTVHKGTVYVDPAHPIRPQGSVAQ
jgi:hypothetical protein